MFDFDINFPVDRYICDDGEKCNFLPAEFIPKTDESYQFNEDVSKAVLAGFQFNRRVLLHGLHGSGKSSHIEQIAAKLGWPCFRVNFDGYISRIDLVGRDVILLEDGKQITKFQEGILPWAMQNGMALILDEYDAARPDVLFVLQRLLETDGMLTLTEQNRVIKPHKNFRIFATSNTIGLGDATGMYHGTNPINQGQMDRWHIIMEVKYPDAEIERKIIAKKVKNLTDKTLIGQIVDFANLTRNSYKAGDISGFISPRTSIAMAENYIITKNIKTAIKYSFYNKTEQSERPHINELYQKVFAEEL